MGEATNESITDSVSALQAEDTDEGRREEKKGKKEGKIRIAKRWKQNRRVSGRALRTLCK